MHHLKMSQQVNRRRRRRAGLSKLITQRVINTKIKWKQAKLPWVPPQIKSWKNSKDSAWKKPSRLARRGTMLAFLNSRVITRLIAGTKKYVRGKKLTWNADMEIISIWRATWKLFWGNYANVGRQCKGASPFDYFTAYPFPVQHLITCAAFVSERKKEGKNCKWKFDLCSNKFT